MPASTATVTVPDRKRSSFVPTNARIKTGDTVRWVNSGHAEPSGRVQQRSFVSPILGPGKTSSHRFTASGTYRYHDGLNPTVRRRRHRDRAAAGGDDRRLALIIVYGPADHTLWHRLEWQRLRKG